MEAEQRRLREVEEELGNGLIQLREKLHKQEVKNNWEKILQKLTFLGVCSGGKSSANRERAGGENISLIWTHVLKRWRSKEYHLFCGIATYM